MREEHSSKAYEPIVESFDLDSNDTVSSESHFLKQEFPSLVTELGIANPSREEQDSKTYALIAGSFDLDSNDIVLSRLQSLKQ